jgi:hypothetical protein
VVGQRSGRPQAQRLAAWRDIKGAGDQLAIKTERHSVTPADGCGHHANWRTPASVEIALLFDNAPIPPFSHVRALEISVLSSIDSPGTRIRSESDNPYCRNRYARRFITPGCPPRIPRHPTRPAAMAAQVYGCLGTPSNYCVLALCPGVPGVVEWHRGKGRSLVTSTADQEPHTRDCILGRNVAHGYPPTEGGRK